MGDLLSRALDRLLERAVGPFHFRFLIQPLVALWLGIRAGLRDARAGHPPYLWHLFSNPSQRRNLFRSGWKDIGGVAVVGFVMDMIYQLVMFRWFYPRQALVVAFLLAIVPYVLVRGPAARVASRRGVEGHMRSQVDAL